MGVVHYKWPLPKLFFRNLHKFIILQTSLMDPEPLPYPATPADVPEKY